MISLLYVSTWFEHKCMFFCYLSKVWKFVFIFNSTDKNYIHKCNLKVPKYLLKYTYKFPFLVLIQYLIFDDM